MGPIEQKIYDKLIHAFNPEVIEITNESGKHAKHMGMKPMNAANPDAAANISESHFRLLLKSPKFDGVSRLDRQRMVLDTLKDEMKVVHALAMTVKGSGE